MDRLFRAYWALFASPGVYGYREGRTKTKVYVHDILAKLDPPNFSLFEDSFNGVFSPLEICINACRYIRKSFDKRAENPTYAAKALRKYVRARNWKVALEVEDIGSGVKERKKREQVMDAARRREIDVVLVWKLDRWGGLFMTCS
ncbi:MAG: recombinase family protein [Candidatus Obscuribacter sp.]|nr:recombinase family protein [Candidatus Obscuribacter sp.]